MPKPGFLESRSPALRVKGLVRGFGERAVLRGLSFSLPVGATLAVLGPNGAGKTTLLRVLAGLLRPQGGEVEVLGLSLPAERQGLKGMVGLLGHDPLLYRELTPRQNLRLYAALQGVEEREGERLLGKVGAVTVADRPLRELSQGMVQRVAVARALLADPPLLLLDEPHANLDPAARERLAPLVGRESGRTRVLTSHQPAQALAEADLVLGLKSGRTVYLGSPAELNRQTLKELYR